MGQHKYNPTAIAAAKGELPPKPEKMSKREWERQLYAECKRILYTPLVDAYIKMQDEEYAEKVLHSKEN